MGGVRNLEEKKKAAKVFSSGGGGGTKGPSVLDKRNQELPCPHCDRVFKQARRKRRGRRDGERTQIDRDRARLRSTSLSLRLPFSCQVQRYREHLASKHADVEGGEADAVSLASGSSASAAASSGPSPSQPPPPPAAMDVGARAGYYTEKSPKVLLQEWAAGARDRGKPRYRAKCEGGGGGGGEGGEGGDAAPAPTPPSSSFTAKVVIPGTPSKPDTDTVAFTPRGATYPSAAEAEQAAAVAGLHAVAGDRALHRVLPRAYRPQWESACEAAADRASRDAARASAAAAHAAREKAAKDAAIRRAPTSVVMTDEQRAAVAAALGAGTGSRSSAAPPAMSSDPAAVAAVADRLARLGFAPRHARAAAQATAGTSSDTAALDWAVLHTPESGLPAAYASGAGGAVTVMRRRGVAVAKDEEGDAVAAVAEAALAELLGAHPTADRLLAAGYEPADTAAALAGAGGDVERAGVGLYSALLEAAGVKVCRGVTAATTTPADPAEADDEASALASIYGEEGGRLTLAPAPGGGRVVTVVLDDGGDGAAGGGGNGGGAPSWLTLTVHLPPGYPASAGPSRLTLTCPGAPRPALRAATVALAAEAAAMEGLPVVHDLVCAALGVWEAALAGRGGEEEASPPVDDSAVAASASRILHDGAAGRRNGCPAPGPHARRTKLNPAAAAAESARLAAAATARRADPAARPMLATRAGLPMARARGELLAAVAGHHVTIVKGETGCGKSTQVPQFLLEAAVEAGRGGEANILVAQPRRVAAVGLASRVSAERGEGAPGGTVGYSVRLETRMSGATRLAFMTTGVLLRRLLGPDGLDGVTHVVVDEVHERSIDSDLALMLLKQRLNDASSACPKIILMSATADAETFVRYFGPHPIATLSVPGRTFPVRDLYLEDAFAATGVSVGKVSRYAKRKGGGHGGGGGGGAPPKQSTPASWDEGGGSSGAAVPAYPDHVARSLATVDEAVINYDLVEALVAHALAAEAKGGPGALLAGWSPPEGEAVAPPPPNSPPGSILVFMPGAPEIGRCVRQLAGSRAVAAATGGGPLLVLPLHGGLSPEAQGAAFGRPPPGGRKVVVSTNVAETSVTIDDVTVVIDTGRVKEMAHDPDAGIGRLQETWVSAASARQRRGRAGRVRPGACFKLFSRRTAAKLAADTAPEVMRAPLEGLCLALRSALGPGGPKLATALAGLPTPPLPASGAAAVTSLTRMGALEPGTEALTPLGAMLARLPMDPRLAKALVYGCLLQCAGPVLSTAAALSHGRPLFSPVPPELRADADAGRAAVSPAAHASKSDHLALAEAYAAWDAARDGRGGGSGGRGSGGGGRAAARDLASRCFLSDGAMEATRSARADLARTMVEVGLLPPGYPSAASTPGQASRCVALSKEVAEAREQGGHAHPASADPVALADAASHSARVVKAALCAGFAPGGLLRVEHPVDKYAATLGGAVRVDAPAKSLHFRDERGSRVFIHPASICFSAGRFDSGWLVASGIVHVAGKASTRVVSAAPAYGVLLFGGRLDVRHGDGELVMDGWARFKAPARTGVLIRELRGAVDGLLSAKLADPGVSLVGAPAVSAMHRLLETDGF